MILIFKSEKISRWLRDIKNLKILWKLKLVEN